MNRWNVSRPGLLTTASAAALTAILATAGPTQAIPPWLDDWQNTYPSSLTDDNLMVGKSSGCQVCHASASGGQPWNAYGWNIRQRTQAGMTFLQALADVEALDSDEDPNGCSNIDEINGNSQPGWTPGPNNTLVFGDGTPQPNQDPPPDPNQSRLDQAQPCCPADLDGDGNVNTVDLLALLAAWGTDPGGPPDLDGDGTVATTDLLQLLAAWGGCP